MRARTFLLFVTAFLYHHQQLFLILPGILVTQTNHDASKRHGLYEIREENIAREALYLADEVFHDEHSCEIVPVRSVDKITVDEGKRELLQYF